MLVQKTSRPNEYQPLKNSQRYGGSWRCLGNFSGAELLQVQRRPIVSDGVHNRERSRNYFVSEYYGFWQEI